MDIGLYLHLKHTAPDCVWATGIIVTDDTSLSRQCIGCNVEYGCHERDANVGWKQVDGGIFYV